jgi:predicted small secreted protein
MAKLIIGFMLVISCIFVFSCNTVKGLGQDVQKLGEVIRDAAE